MMAFTPRRLPRLFPGLWRARYGDEFLAMLERTPLTRTIIVDVVRAAAGEWLTNTRIGRLLLGLVIAFAATVAVASFGRFVAPAPAPYSLWALAALIVHGWAPVWIGMLLILMKTRRDRRYEWLRLRYELIALFLAATWALSTDAAFRAAYDIRAAGLWQSTLWTGLMVGWMLVLLLNVDRRREPFYAWRRYIRWIGSDRF